MDSRDSSSAAASDAGRDVSVSDDDATLFVTSGLAKDAVSYFRTGKFAECIEILNQLNQMKENDPRILHNIALAEYFRDGSSNPKRLLEALHQVKKQSEELACVTREEGEDIVNHGNNSVVSTESSIEGHNSTTVCNDEFDNIVTMFNTAVTWFHLHEYAKALSILEPLFQNIEPVDETIAVQICFLLLDVVMACRDAVKFADVLNYMERAYGSGCGNQVENGTKTSSIPSSSLSSDTANSDSAAGETTLSRTLSDETLEYDNVFAEIGAHNLTKPVDRFLANNLVKAIGYRSISTVDLKLELQLYKVRFLILTRNLKLAKREAKLAMNIARGRDSSVALVLKSQLEYARGNSIKAIKLLMASGIQTETGGASSMFNNNLGCIYYQLGKYHTASIFFSKALSISSSHHKEKPAKLLSLSLDKSMLITYNCGMLYLACGKPLLAARCFQKASRVYYRQPLLWLRIAECCLMASQKGLLEEGKSCQEIRVHVVGKGKWRHLLMEENGHVGVAGSANNQWPKLSFTLARLCLANAMYLLDGNDLQTDSSLEISESKTGESSSGPDMVIQNSLMSYKDVRKRENHMIRQALLADMAYIELEMENPVKALSAANTLLELRECSKIYTFLGHVYAAEALCLLNRTKEAGEHICVYLQGTSGQEGFELPYLQEEYDQWLMHRNVEREEANEASTGETKVMKAEEARGALYANMAAMVATTQGGGNIEKAKEMVTKALSILPNSVEATLTGVYIDVKMGRAGEAVSKLRQCNRVSFLPRSCSRLD